MVVATERRPRSAPTVFPSRVVAPARRAIAEALPPLLLLAFTAGVFLTELLGGPIAYGRDTTVFYYPLTEWAAGELRAGRLPFWLPSIFGGYPVLADGEIGVLSPVNAPFLLWLPMPLAYTWMRAAHFAIAALGLYLLARALGANTLGASIGGLAFAFGSFMVGHLQHDNILRSAAWLPWVLAAAEYALRARAARRLAWIALGAAALALAALGIHVQPVLLTIVALGLFVAGGPFGPHGAGLGVDGVAVEGAGSVSLGPGRVGLAGVGLGKLRASVRPWLVDRLLVGGGIVVLGLALAGMQLAPLYELGQRSLRPSLVTYAYATSYAVSAPQLLTLLFPLMFNFDETRHWALWAPHETTLYVGVVPLVLALVAMACVRGRAVGFMSVLALVSLLLSMGDYLPFKAYGLVWQLPGFNVLRAPARFGLLFELALACLAAFGATWVVRRARLGGRPRFLASFLATLMLVPLVLALGIGGVRWWLQHDPATASAVLDRLLQTSKENWQLGRWHVVYGLLEFTRPANVHTALGLALLALAPLVVRAWLWRPRLEPAWGSILLGATCVELWLFAASFYPTATLDELRPSSPAAQFLAGQERPFRAFVEPTLNPRLGANQLVMLDVATVNGYSSLEPPRFADFWWNVVMQDNYLLDLFGVRYVVAARAPAGLRDFESTTYHPGDRLMSGAASNPSGEETFRVQPTPVDRVVVVAAVEGAGAAPRGTPLAELDLIGEDGAMVTVPLRAGVEVAEFLATEPGYPLAGYDGPRVVWAGPLFTPTGAGPAVRLYGSTVSVTPSSPVVAARARALPSAGRLHLHGLGLRASEGNVVSVRSADKAKYRAVLEDPAWTLLENTAAWPRVSVVGSAVAGGPGATIAEQLHARAWDPRREVVLEGAAPADLLTSASPEPPGRAELVRYDPSIVVVRVEMDAPGYLLLADRYDEAWRAKVDDRDERMWRANVVERAVRVPAGSHVVTFAYDPFPFKVGFALTVFAAVVVAALLLAGVLPPLARPRALRPRAVRRVRPPQARRVARPGVLPARG